MYDSGGTVLFQQFERILGSIATVDDYRQPKLLREDYLLLKQDYLLIAVIALVVVVEPYLPYRAHLRIGLDSVRDDIEIIRGICINALGVDTRGCIDITVPLGKSGILGGILNA